MVHPIRIASFALLWVITGIVMSLHVVGVAVGEWGVAGGFFWPSLLLLLVLSFVAYVNA